VSTDDIYARLTEIFRDVFDDDDIVLTPNTTAADIQDWDSFNHINLIVAIETRFGIKFQTAEIESLKNVGDMVAVIERKIGAAVR
jgi:acyl carrier protein